MLLTDQTNLMDAWTKTRTLWLLSRLPCRVANCLVNESPGISPDDDLSCFPSKEQMLKWPNFGRKSFEEYLGWVWSRCTPSEIKNKQPSYVRDLERLGYSFPRPMQLERLGPNRFILANDDRLLDWIANRIPGVNAGNWKGFANAIGVVLKGEIVAGMAVGGWERGNIEISFAADNAKWATRDTIRKLMAYPLVQLDCHRCTVRCASSNERALKFVRGIGFKDEGILRQGWGPDEDAIILGLLRSEAPDWMLAKQAEIA